MYVCSFRGEVEFQYSKTAKQLELTRTEIFSLTQQFEENLKRIEVYVFSMMQMHMIGFGLLWLMSNVTFN